SPKRYDAPAAHGKIFAGRKRADCLGSGRIRPAGAIRKGVMGPMPLGTIDRRVSRTRTLLHNALLSSLRSKSYDAITVEDLCTKAKIGRSTFYAHYTSKDDLLRTRLTHLRDTLIERRRAAAAGRATGKGLVFSGIMFEHAYEHVHLHRHLLGN